MLCECVQVIRCLHGFVGQSGNPGESAAGCRGDSFGCLGDLPGCIADLSECLRDLSQRDVGSGSSCLQFPQAVLRGDDLPFQCTVLLGVLIHSGFIQLFFRFPQRFELCFRVCYLLPQQLMFLAEELGIGRIQLEELLDILQFLLGFADVGVYAL